MNKGSKMENPPTGANGDGQKGNGDHFSNSIAIVPPNMPSRQDLLAAIAREPLLTDFGFGVYSGHRLTAEEYQAALEQGREQLKNRLEEFRLCVFWLSLCERRKTINPNRGSYSLKHRTEDYFNIYVSNGCLIAAAIYLKIPFRQTYPGSPNAFLAIGNKLPVWEGAHGHH